MCFDASALLVVSRSKNNGLVFQRSLNVYVKIIKFEHQHVPGNNRQERKPAIR